MARVIYTAVSRVYPVPMKALGRCHKHSFVGRLGAEIPDCTALFFPFTLHLLSCKVCSTKLPHSKVSHHENQIGLVEQHFR